MPNKIFKDFLILLATISTVLSFNILPAVASEKITVLLDWFINPDHAPLIIAKEKGFFTAAGLDVN